MYSGVNIKYHTLFNFPPKLHCNNKSNYLREKYNIKNHQNILLYQGVLQPGRGIKQMIQIVYNTNHNVGIIIGDGELIKKLLKREFLQITLQIIIGFQVYMEDSYIEYLYPLLKKLER